MAIRKTKRGESMLEGVELVFRNFGGKQGKYNRAGDRNFCAIVSDEIAEEMVKDGWRIKYLEPRSEEDERRAYFKVKVNYDSEWPPQIVMITERGKTTLDAESVGNLDYADITNVDLVINPYQFDADSPLTAYLSRAYVTIEEDEFEAKYGDVEDSARSSVEFEPFDD